MIRGSFWATNRAGERHLDVAILALRQAQGEGVWWGEPEVLSTIGHVGSAGNSKPVDISTLTLSLSKGEDGNAVWALAVMVTIPTANVGSRSPAAVPLP